MVPDEFQQAWQSQASQTRITIDRELLLNEVRRSQLALQATIFARDVREVVVALVLLPVWFIMGYMLALPWTWYLVVPALVWVAGFILVDRKRHKQKPSEPGETLLETAKHALRDVEHQIWLLRNVVWWYLMPFTIPILFFFGQVAWRTASNGWELAASFALPTVFVLGIYAFIYWLNQFAVRTNLEPRRQELLALIAGLDSPGESLQTGPSRGDEKPR